MHVKNKRLASEAARKIVSAKRISLGLSYRRLADLCAVQHSQIYRFLNNELSNGPSRDLCEALIRIKNAPGKVWTSEEMAVLEYIRDFDKRNGLA